MDEKKYKLLVIGGSAGSLEIVLSIVSELRQLKVPVIIVLHRKTENENLLVGLLAERTNYLVREAEDKELLMPETIYIAPANYHLLVEKNQSLSLDFSERVNFSRPSIDVCFETASEAFTKELVCVLLSGANADGAAGLQQVKVAGGLTIVQDPLTAEVPYMPQQAIAKFNVDHVVPGAALAGFINEVMK